MLSHAALKAARLYKRQMQAISAQLAEWRIMHPTARSVFTEVDEEIEDSQEWNRNVLEGLGRLRLHLRDPATPMNTARSATSPVPLASRPPSPLGRAGPLLPAPMLPMDQGIILVSDGAFSGRRSRSRPPSPLGAMPVAPVGMEQGPPSPRSGHRRDGPPTFNRSRSRPASPLSVASPAIQGAERRSPSQSASPVPISAFGRSEHLTRGSHARGTSPIDTVSGSVQVIEGAATERVRLNELIVMVNALEELWDIILAAQVEQLLDEDPTLTLLDACETSNGRLDPVISHTKQLSAFEITSKDMVVVGNSLLEVLGDTAEMQQQVNTATIGLLDLGVIKHTPQQQHSISEHTSRGSILLGVGQDALKDNAVKTLLNLIRDAHAMWRRLTSTSFESLSKREVLRQVRLRVRVRIMFSSSHQDQDSLEGDGRREILNPKGELYVWVCDEIRTCGSSECLSWYDRRR